MTDVGLAISDEHRELAATATRWLAARGALSTARAVLETAEEELPGWWPQLVALGWAGLAVSEERGGQGYGVAELAVVLEQTGTACLPGPLLPTAIVATALDRWGGDDAVVEALAAGGTAGFALDGALTATDGPELVVSGTASHVWSAVAADVLLLPVDAGGTLAWCLVDRDAVTVRELHSFDPTRRLAEVTLEGVPVPASRRLSAGAHVEALAGVLAAAEALGVAQWCVDTAAEHARDRKQFGRPIGQFQAVKHRCTNMLAELETARAAVWDAARELDGGDEPGLAVAAARTLGPEAGFSCAKGCIQVLGGIGYTWEHDAHIFLKRAAAVRHLLPPPAEGRATMTRLAASGALRSLAIELPEGAEEIRERVKAFVADLTAKPKEEWNRTLADNGYLVPHWPKPWGLDASPIEQLVIDEELRAAKVRRPHLQVGAWVLPTLIGHGSPDQQERWIPPTMRGELRWCQMFSEPEAGSDLAGLTTRATRVEGGWSITGQKVWTTMAREADWAICLARTDPDAPKHAGIGCFMVDMETPGIDVRPLRELTGMAMFNEVFLTDVFVPDDCVVGPPTAGWEAARTTLANERVSMAGGSSFGPGTLALLELARERGVIDDALVIDRIGGLLVEAHALAALSTRTTLRALGGGQPGPEASVRKLLGVEHEQDVQEVGLDLLGPDAAVTEGPGYAWTGGFLGNRALSIAGGTSEIQRSLIAERLLGLPKDP